MTRQVQAVGSEANALPTDRSVVQLAMGAMRGVEPQFMEVVMAALDQSPQINRSVMGLGAVPITSVSVGPNFQGSNKVFKLGPTTSNPGCDFWVGASKSDWLQGTASSDSTAFWNLAIGNLKNDPSQYGPDKINPLPDEGGRASKKATPTLTR